MATNDQTCVVNGDNPSVLDRWRIESHKSTGEQRLTLSEDGDHLFLDGKKVGLCRWDKRKCRGALTWEDLVKELENKDVLTASHFDSMFPGGFKRHPYPQPRPFVPSRWGLDEKISIMSVYYFPGTILRDPEGYLCVPCMFFDCSGWTHSYARLDREGQGLEDHDGYALVVES